MKSDKIEYIRFDDLSTGILMGNKPYILSHGDFCSLQEVRTPMGQIELLEQLGEQLRYDSKTSGTAMEKWETIKKCSDQIHSLFLGLDRLPNDISHLEIYLNPSELALIPFELLLNDSGQPLFVNKNGEQLVLTRNFRRNTIKYVPTPSKPRVLFVHSKPDHKNFLGLPFPDIPFKDHEQSLKYALRHWNPEKQITVLDNPTFEEFSTFLYQADKNNEPFTHIHILAHGSLLLDHKRPSNFEYGIAFHSKEPLDSPYKPTTAKEIKILFELLHTLPYFVNYMICDGANFTNGTKPDRNPVQATFKAGVPIVIGSQFPLSVKGSNKITKELYKRLFRAEDIRTILGNIRTQLYAGEQEYHHDWISLVSYINLPHNYEFQLLMLKMEYQLVILNSIRNSTLQTNTEAIPSKDDFIRAKVQIEESINDLSAQVKEIEYQKSKEEAFLENSGLLASAFKRLAEIEYRESLVLDGDTTTKQKQYLNEAKKWYKKAADRNLSHHWSIVQYISLATLLDGGPTKAKGDYWCTARLAALTEIDANDALDKKNIWAYGSLLELYLLKTDGYDNDLKTQIIHLTEQLVSNAKIRNNPEAIVATKYQLLRYKDWWSCPEFIIPEGTLVKNRDFLQLVIDRLDC
ncbi:CHAT domain-containing protein [Arenibacter certesii]|uniref:CHAT domain-containing protein n=1 Tax=Arenibacter certesii TaxID=228955 RepID=A0A918IXS4_9FLAO|nr:CHAT domain-containing protein [Arenibacter certesii]GGW37133.1 hypothetical protein GCM10007383_22490 [Arenibacter certesii]